MGKRGRAKPGDLVLATVEENGIEVQIRRRRGSPNLQLVATDLRNGKRATPRTSRTGDLELATQRARALCVELGRRLGHGRDDWAMYLGVRGKRITLGDLFDAYRDIFLPVLAHTDQLKLDGNMKRMELVWGRDLRLSSLSQMHVDLLVKRRKEGIEGPGIATRSRNGVNNNTIRDDFIRLGTFINKVGALMYDDAPVIPRNPLYSRNISIPPPDDDAMRPIADARRYRLYQEFAPGVIPAIEASKFVSTVRDSGQKLLWETFLTVVRETGRRVGAIRQLKVGDLLLTLPAMRSALAVAGSLHQESWAAHWPDGAIQWAARADKKRYNRIMPLSNRLRATLDEYIEANAMTDPSQWLFPDTVVEGEPLTVPASQLLIYQTDRLIWAAGHDLPKLKNGQFHPFRRMWRSERYGAFERGLVAWVGGWSRWTGEAMDDSYLGFLPLAVRVCVEFNPAVHRTRENAIPGVLMPGLAEAVLGTEVLDRLMAAHKGEEPMW